MKKILLAGVAALMASSALATTTSTDYYTAGIYTVTTVETTTTTETVVTGTEEGTVVSTVIPSSGNNNGTINVTSSDYPTYDNFVEEVTNSSWVAQQIINNNYMTIIYDSVPYYVYEGMVDVTEEVTSTSTEVSHGCNVNADTAYVNQRVYWMDRTGLGIGSDADDIRDVIENNRTGTTANFSHAKACWAEGLLNPSGYVETIYDVVNTALNSENSHLEEGDELAVAYLNTEAAVSIPETFTHWSLVPAGYDWIEFHMIWAEANSTEAGRTALSSWVSQWNAVNQRAHSWWDFEAGVLEYIYEGNHSGSYPGYE